jgi:hypothetical protein
MDLPTDQAPNAQASSMQSENNQRTTIYSNLSSSAQAAAVQTVVNSSPDSNLIRPEPSEYGYLGQSNGEYFLRHPDTGQKVSLDVRPSSQEYLLKALLSLYQKPRKRSGSVLESAFKRRETSKPPSSPTSPLSPLGEAADSGTLPTGSNKSASIASIIDLFAKLAFEQLRNKLLEPQPKGGDLMDLVKSPEVKARWPRLTEHVIDMLNQMKDLTQSGYLNMKAETDGEFRRWLDDLEGELETLAGMNNQEEPKTNSKKEDDKKDGDSCGEASEKCEPVVDGGDVTMV